MVFQFKTNVTLNFDNSMTLNQMQHQIDLLPKNLNTHTFTIQFADGTYNLGGSLTLDGFTGRVYIQGNTGENYNAKHSNQAVILNFTGGTLICTSCEYVRITNLKIISTTTAIATVYTGSYEIFGCCLSGALNTDNGVYIGMCHARVNYTYFTQFNYGIFADLAFVSVYNNQELTTAPKYGIGAANGGAIGILGGTGIAGVTANQNDSGGGITRIAVGTAIVASDPPTQAEMVTALGAASLYPHQERLIRSTGGTPYLVYSDGTSWYYNAFTVGA